MKSAITPETLYSIKKEVEQREKKKQIVVLCGKSASGKTTLAKYLSENFGYDSVISATTRPKRQNEQDGVDYYFLSEEEFKRLVEEDRFLETTNYRGWYYGVLKSELDTKESIVIVADYAGLLNLKLAGVKFTSFYIDRKDKDRFISSINRGDDILEIALRNERDKACFQNIAKEVDFVIENNEDVSVVATKLLEKLV